MVIFWTFDRGDAGSKPPIAVTDLGNFVHPTLSFRRYSKNRSSCLPGVYIISHAEKWNQIYRELNEYVFCSLKSVFISGKDVMQHTTMSHRARLSSLY